MAALNRGSIVHNSRHFAQLFLLNWALLSLPGTSLRRRKLLNLLLSRPHWLASSLCLLRPPPRHRRTSTSASWAPRTSCPCLSPTTGWPASRTQRTWPRRSTKSPPPWRRPRCCRWAATRTGGRRPAATSSRRTASWGVRTRAATPPPAGRSACSRFKLEWATRCWCARTVRSDRRTNAGWAGAAELAAEPERTTCLSELTQRHVGWWLLDICTIKDEV